MEVRSREPTINAQVFMIRGEEGDFFVIRSVLTVNPIAIASPLEESMNRGEATYLFSSERTMA